MSPEGAMSTSPTTVGRASFGFNAKYKRGAEVPDGETNFEFSAWDFHFHSEEYEWLVVAGLDRAKFKGVGTVNGTGSFGFMVTVQDVDEPGTEADTFRIKIWDLETDEVVYDNQLGADDDGYDGTTISGGNIKIHVPKGNRFLRD